MKNIKFKNKIKVLNIYNQKTMSDISYSNNKKVYQMFFILFFFQLFGKVSPQLDNIIQLNYDNYIYNHISINSEGDMIIDSSSSINKERIFYGLKKMGILILALRILIICQLIEKIIQEEMKGKQCL